MAFARSADVASVAPQDTPLGCSTWYDRGSSVMTSLTMAGFHEPVTWSRILTCWSGMSSGRDRVTRGTTSVVVVAAAISRGRLPDSHVCRSS